MYFMRATSLLAVGYLVLPSLNKGFIIIIIKVVHMNLGAGSRDSNHFVISYFSLITCLTVAGVRR